MAIVLPFLPWGVGAWFGFAPTPPLFFAFLAITTVANLAIVEHTKAVFYRSVRARRSVDASEASP